MPSIYYMHIWPYRRKGTFNSPKYVNQAYAKTINLQKAIKFPMWIAIIAEPTKKP
jgi:hypothetical protein